LAKVVKRGYGQQLQASGSKLLALGATDRSLGIQPQRWMRVFELSRHDDCLWEQGMVPL
jgi:hypothetical protein